MLIQQQKTTKQHDTYHVDDHPFKTLNLEDVKKKIMSVEHYNKLKQHVLSLYKPSEQSPTLYESKPKDFDLRNFKSMDMDKCIGAIRDQQNCGSCWAFASAETMSDRACLKTFGRVNVTLSPQRLVSCESNSFGCDGGYMEYPWDYANQYGMVSDSCVPYTSGEGNSSTGIGCSSVVCNDTQKPPKQVYMFSKGYVLNSATLIKSVLDGSSSIFDMGPVSASFDVYESFFSYKSGIYNRICKGSECDNDPLAGGHAVKLVGYGKQNGTDYFIAANSWGSGWAENGFFRIAQDTCNISKYAAVGNYKYAASYPLPVYKSEF